MALASSLHSCGWTPSEDPNDPEILRMADDLLDLAESYPVGTIIGHWLYEVALR
jgi:hypothetical protein